MWPGYLGGTRFSNLVIPSSVPQCGTFFFWYTPKISVTISSGTPADLSWNPRVPLNPG